MTYYYMISRSMVGPDYDKFMIEIIQKGRIRRIDGIYRTPQTVCK